MFTNNWYKVLAATMGIATTKYITMAGNEESVRTDTGYKSLQVGYNPGSQTDPNIPSMYVIKTNTDGGGGVIFGTGSKPASVEDIALSGEMVTTLSASAIVTKNVDDGGVTLEAVYTINNTGSSPITIGEIGLIAQASQGTNYTNGYIKALLEHTVLETPVTIPAGGVGQVTYTIRMDYPTA